MVEGSDSEWFSNDDLHCSYYPGLKKFITECREFKGPMMVAPSLSHSDSMLVNSKSPLLQDV